MEAPIIELKNVALTFGKVAVHRDISFKVRSGESITILGPSGTGKTLLLKIIIGLLNPTHGSVQVMGRRFDQLNEEALRLARRDLGMLFQGAALFDSLNVFENISYGLRERGEVSPENLRQVVAERLDLVGLPGIEQKYPPQLSGGQKKRVGLARALASSPKIILFDEPTTGLDPTAVRMIDDQILMLKEKLGITCITVTHDIESAKRISDRWLLINNGVVVADGAVADITRKSGEVQDFITGNWKE